MRKTKYYTTIFLIVFLMLCIISVYQIDLTPTYDYDLNLNADDNPESWSRIIKSGSSIELIDNHTYIIGIVGAPYIDYDIYLAKFNSSGTKLWEQTWGGTEFNHIKDYIVDSENNIYIAGITSTFYIGFSGSIFLLKYNSSGNLLWSKTIDPFGSNRYDIHSIQTDLNDSIYISSTIDNYTNSKTFITKLNSSGNILWTQEIELNDQPFDLMTQIDSVGNIYLHGDCYTINSFLLKLNSSGSRQWYYEWGEREYGFHMKLDLDENIIITGRSYNSGIDKYEVWIMKINNSGNLTKKIICNSFGGFPKIEVWFLDNIFVLAGSSLFEYNYSLNSKWNFTFGSHMQIDNSGGFNFGINSQHEMYFIYYTVGDITILRFNSSGAIISNFKWGGSYYVYPPKVTIDSQDNLYMLCLIHYENIWKELIHLKMLVKNPKSGGKPQLDQIIDDRDIFVFSLLGVMSFISVILVYTILKPKFRKLKYK